MVGVLRMMIASWTICIGVASAGEVGELTLVAEDQLEGHILVDYQQIAIKLIDRDQNGDFNDSVDRLFLDLDGDGQFHPLKERFAVSQTLRLRGVGEADHYEFSLREDPWRVQLIPVHGSGLVRLLLSGKAPDAELIKMTATLVSRSGLHRQITQLDEPIELPTGQYRVEELGLEFQSDRRWSIAFSNFNNDLDYDIEIHTSAVTAFELLGKLTLSARVVGGALGNGKLTIQPAVISETGLTLVCSRVGQQSAVEDNRLIASLLRVGNNDQESAMDVKGTGFACGQFCPIELSSRQRVTSGMMIALKFDAGPLGGPMFVVTTAKRPGQSLTESATDSLDFSP